MTPTKSRKAGLATRRKLHRQALVAAEMTQAAFCEAVGCSRHHVNEVFRGKRESARILDASAALIRKHLKVTL